MISGFVEELGAIFVLVWKAIAAFFKGEGEWEGIVKQMVSIGVESVPVVTLTTAFSGMVLALNSYIGFSRLGAIQYTGSVVGISLVKELIPVLTGIVIAGRVGAAMAAEIGTMKVSEQIDALYTLNADPISYLVLPRIIAAVFMVPVLTLYGDGIGLIGAYFVSVVLMGVNPSSFTTFLFMYMEPWDIITGLIKALSFGAIIAAIGCYKGISAKEGAEGVGKATTSSVVNSSITILIIDFIWGKILPWTLRG